MTEVLVKISKNHIRLKKGNEKEKIRRDDYRTRDVLGKHVTVTKDTVSFDFADHMPNRSTGEYVKMPTCTNMDAVRLVKLCAWIMFAATCVCAAFFLSMEFSDTVRSPSNNFILKPLSMGAFPFVGKTLFLLSRKGTIFPRIYNSDQSHSRHAYKVTDEGTVFVNGRLLFSYRPLTLPVKPPAPQGVTNERGPVGPPGIGHKGEPGIEGIPLQNEYHSPNRVYEVAITGAFWATAGWTITLTNTITGKSIEKTISGIPIGHRVTNQGSFGHPDHEPTLSFSQRIRRLQSPDGRHTATFDEESCTMTFPTSRQRQFADTPCQLIMQEDRNLVAYNRAGEPLWASDTANHEEELALEVLDDGRLCLVNEKKECVRWVVESKI